MSEKESVDPQLEDFILAETQKQRFQVSKTLISELHVQES